MTKPQTSLLVIAALTCLTAMASLVEIPVASQKPRAANTVAKGGPAATQPGTAELTPPVSPDAPKKAIQDLAARREKLEATLKKVSEKIRDKDKLDLRTERETLHLYRDLVIPALRNWRRSILDDQSQIMTDLNGYIVTNESAIGIFRSAVKNGRPVLRTEKARQQRVQLDGERQRIAGVLSDRHKEVSALAADLTEFLYYVEDSGTLLDEWEAIVLGLIETDEKGDAALQRIQGLRDFAREFEAAFTHFIDAVSRLDYGIPKVAEDEGPETKADPVARDSR